MTKLLVFLAIVCTLLAILHSVIRISNTIEFQNNCSGYLSRVANANTIEMAAAELKKAIDYAEKNNLTSGIVSIFFKNPKNDIGFCYNNMVSAYNELLSVDENAT